MALERNHKNVVVCTLLVLSIIIFSFCVLPHFGFHVPKLFGKKVVKNGTDEIVKNLLDELLEYAEKQAKDENSIFLVDSKSARKKREGLKTPSGEVKGGMMSYNPEQIEVEIGKKNSSKPDITSDAVNKIQRSFLDLLGENDEEKCKALHERLEKIDEHFLSSKERQWLQDEKWRRIGYSGMSRRDARAPRASELGRWQHALKQAGTKTGDSGLKPKTGGLKPKTSESSIKTVDSGTNTEKGLGTTPHSVPESSGNATNAKDHKNPCSGDINGEADDIAAAKIINGFIQSVMDQASKVQNLKNELGLSRKDDVVYQSFTNINKTMTNEFMSNVFGCLDKLVENTLAKQVCGPLPPDMQRFLEWLLKEGVSKEQACLAEKATAGDEFANFLFGGRGAKNVTRKKAVRNKRFMIGYNFL